MLNKITSKNQWARLVQSTFFFKSQAGTLLAKSSGKTAATTIDATANKKSQASIVVTQLNGASPVTLLKLDGPLDVKIYRDVIKVTKTAIETGTQCIIFDMSDVPSLGLTSMVALHSIAALLKGEEPLNLEHDGYAVMHAIAYDLKTSDKQHNFKLLNPQPHVKAQLDKNGFTDYLDICTESIVDIKMN